MDLFPREALRRILLGSRRAESDILCPSASMHGRSRHTVGKRYLP
jgi:hypothetical protein